MKKFSLILVTVFLNIFLFSCSSDGVIESSEIVETQSTETFATGGEDEQTPAGEDDEDDEE